MPRFTVDLDKEGNLRLTANEPNESIGSVVEGYPFFGKIPPTGYDGKMAIMKLSSKEDYELLKGFLSEHYNMDLTIDGKKYSVDGILRDNKPAALQHVDTVLQSAKSTSAPVSYQAPVLSQTSATFSSSGLFTVTMRDAVKVLEGWFPGRTVKATSDDKGASVQLKDEKDADKAKSFINELRVPNAGKLLDDIGSWANGLKEGLLKKVGSFFNKQ